MAYITATEIINMRVNANAPKSDIQIVRDLINSDRDSEEKIELRKSQNYYEAQHDILGRKITYFADEELLEDRNATNNKVVHPFHKIIVDQKVSYVVGNPIVVQTEDEAFDKALQPYLGDKFSDKMNKWVKGASNYGKQYLHWYITGEGELDYLIIDSVQIIPIYDTKYQEILVEVIRYYTIELITPRGIKNLTAAEWWTGEQVTYYLDDGEGNFSLDPNHDINPMPHWMVKNSANPDPESKSWGKVPFIVLKNNDECIPDIRYYLTLIDDYDLNVSDSSNKLADIEEAIMILKGYEGTDLKEFRKNLKKYRVITTDSSEDSGADTLDHSLNMDARDKHLERLEENIFTFGMAVNPKNQDFGTPSGIALKFLFSLLDLKANTLIRKMKPALLEFVDFIRIWIKETTNKEYKLEGITFTFDKSLIINETEQIDNVSKSTGLISDDTRLANHPWVDDVEEEKKKIEEEGTPPDLDEE